MQITVMTSQREVFRRVGSAMLSRDDVFDVKSQRLKFLGQSAIFTAIVGAQPDGLAQSRVHQPAFVKMRRALACKIPMSVLALI